MQLAMTKVLIMPYMLPLSFVYLSEYLINQGLYENIFWQGIFVDVRYALRETYTAYALCDASCGG